MSRSYGQAKIDPVFQVTSILFCLMERQLQVNLKLSVFSKCQGTDPTNPSPP